jgi:hypothetical protein
MGLPGGIIMKVAVAEDKLLAVQDGKVVGTLAGLNVSYGYHTFEIILRILILPWNSSIFFLRDSQCSSSWRRRVTVA